MKLSIVNSQIYTTLYLFRHTKEISSDFKTDPKDFTLLHPPIISFSRIYWSSKRVPADTKLISKISPRSIHPSSSLSHSRVHSPANEDKDICNEVPARN